jgi:hypothetical protein
MSSVNSYRCGEYCIDFIFSVNTTFVLLSFYFMHWLLIWYRTGIYIWCLLACPLFVYSVIQYVLSHVYISYATTNYVYHTYIAVHV